MTEKIAVKAIYRGDVRRFAIDPALKFAGLQGEVQTRFGLSVESLTLKFKDDEGELCLVTGDEELSEAVRIAAGLTPPILRVHIEVVVEGEKATLCADATQDPLGESARQLLAALDIPVDDAVRFLSSVNVAEEAQKLKAMAPMMLGMFGFPSAREEPAAAQAETQNKPAVHDGVECDGCQMCPIQGIRFKSSTKHDFDLCEHCVKEELYSSDTYTKIEKPDQPHCGFGGFRGPPCGFMRGGPWHKFGQAAQGPSSHGPIDASMLPEGDLHPGMRGPAVATLQQALIQLGHMYPGAVRFARGIFGPRTTQAVAALQHASGEAPTGVYDGTLREKLAKQLASPPPPPPPAGRGGWGWRRGGASQHSSRFVSDKSLPDGAKVQPGDRFTKTWTLRNDGTTAWPETASLVFVKGDRLHDDDVKHVGKVEPGAEVDVSVEMIAPEPTGRYVSFWRLSAVGEAERGRNRPPLVGGFGQRVWLQVVVDGEACQVSSDEGEGKGEAAAEAELLEGRHPAGTPLEQWSVAELKTELLAHGSDVSGCVEKEDLVALLRATLDSQKPVVEQDKEPKIDSDAAAQVEEHVKAACGMLGVPPADASSLLRNLQPLMQKAAEQQSPGGQPFDLGALVQLAQPFLQGLQQPQQQQQQQPSFDLGVLMQNAMPLLNMALAGAQPEPSACTEASSAPTDEPTTAEPVEPQQKPDAACEKTEVPAVVEAAAPAAESQPEPAALPEATLQRLAQLREMGFLDDDENLTALDKADGRVSAAVDILFAAK